MMDFVFGSNLNLTRTCLWEVNRISCVSAAVSTALVSGRSTARTSFTKLTAGPATSYPPLPPLLLTAPYALLRSLSLTSSLIIAGVGPSASLPSVRVLRCSLCRSVGARVLRCSLCRSVGAGGCACRFLPGTSSAAVLASHLWFIFSSQSSISTPVFKPLFASS